MKLPPLRAVQCFESVARLNSFSKAAESLNVTQSAVSHQVRMLEEYLGEAMFYRQGRTVSLTEVGERYFTEVSQSLAILSNASQIIRHGKPGYIRLALYSSVAVNWLIPRLEDFRKQYPEIEITLDMVTDQPDFNDQFADCFITVNPPKRHFVSKLLFTEKLFPVCGQKLWEKIRDKPLPEALWQHPILSVRYSDTNQNIADDWLRWCKAGGFELPSDLKVNQFSHVLFAAEAARYNLGITLINNYMTVDQSHKQNFVRIPMHELKTGDNFYFVYSELNSNRTDITAFGRWLEQQCYTLNI
ncbi:LysR substrate-binding domain-containing protein [Shewanella sp. HL-SH8]|uniref:LysR substrate-binding domain-containing protein n=1 Tax=Shewanella sp. HL-SH8 TaxID=3436242 RepID=UPI003EBD7372